MAAIKLLFALFTAAFYCCSGQGPSFRCTSTGATCFSQIDYVSPNATTLSSIGTLFSVANFSSTSILGANGLSLSTPGNYSVSAGQTVRIRFPCRCANGMGLSDGIPTYTVVPGDGLFHIAAEVFAGLVTYPQIQAANNISNADLIVVGQSLWIPLPCSCDEVGGLRVVHYGHVVPAGSTLEGIAQQFYTAESTLLSLNNLTSAQDLVAGAVLDIPLRACSSSVSTGSQDYPLLVANGTYVFTARDCVMCSCAAANSWMLQCEPSPNQSSCPAIRCEGGGNLSLGNSTTSGCNTTTCAYAGYNGTVLTTLDVQSTCHSSSVRLLQGWRSNGVAIFFHVLLLLSVSFLWF